MSSDGEIFEVINTEGLVIGLASRSELHSNPSLIHRVVHVMIFNMQGELLLQKRSMRKDTAPGKWDTSVGGHVNPGESIYEAAVREMKEELGTVPSGLQFLYSYLFTNHRESELVSTFTYTFDGGFSFNTLEIDEVRYWSLLSIKELTGHGIFSNHFEQEFSRYLQHTEKKE